MFGAMYKIAAVALLGLVPQSPLAPQQVRACVSRRNLLGTATAAAFAVPSAAFAVSARTGLQVSSHGLGMVGVCIYRSRAWHGAHVWEGWYGARRPSPFHHT